MTWLLSHRQRLRSLKWKKWKSRRWLQLCCWWDFMITQVLFGKHLQKLQPNTLSSTCSSAMTYHRVGVPLRTWRKSLKFPELWRHWRYVFFRAHSHFLHNIQNTWSFGRLSNQSAFQCWIYQATKNVGVKGCGRIFFHKPNFTWSDGDACGLQIFELLGRGAAYWHAWMELDLHWRCCAGASGCRVHRCQAHFLECFLKTERNMTNWQMTHEASKFWKPNHDTQLVWDFFDSKLSGWWSGHGGQGGPFASVLDAWFPPFFFRILAEVLALGPATFPDMVEEPWLRLSLFHWAFLCVNKVVHRLKDFEKEVKVLKLVGEYLDRS